jgi:hypothetical protein
MAAVPALARTAFPLSAGSPAEAKGLSGDPSARLQKSLETLFPDLLVHGTRNCLLSMTTSLTKVSGQAHQYFARVSQVLAFERMMRNFMQMAAAVSPFPMNALAANAWSGMFGASQQMPSPWSYLLQPPKSQNPVFAPFLANAFPSRDGRASQVQPWSDYHSLLVVPLAFLVAAPAADQWWKFSF